MLRKRNVARAIRRPCAQRHGRSTAFCECELPLGESNLSLCILPGSELSDPGRARQRLVASSLMGDDYNCLMTPRKGILV